MSDIYDEEFDLEHGISEERDNTEELRIIERFPNYSVSFDGTIINNKTNRILKPSIDSDGQYRVNLSQGFGRRPKTVKVHRIVAEAFCYHPNGYSNVIHIDGNRSNNRADNLIWTRAVTGTKVQVVETREIFDSLHECAAFFGVGPERVLRCLQNPRYTIDGNHIVEV